MKITSKIYKRKLGGASTTRKRKAKYLLRFTYQVKDDGPTKRFERNFPTKEAAVDARPKLEEKIRATAGNFTKGDRMTFADLAKYARQKLYQPAVIKDNAKIAGSRSHRQSGILIDTLEEFFGSKKIGAISIDDLEAYKVWRLEQGDRRKRKTEEHHDIRLSSVNRELAILRRILRRARVNKWIMDDPFENDGDMIARSAERPRSRTLTAVEEAKLLKACEPGIKTIEYERKHRLTGEVEKVKAEVDTASEYLKAIVLLGLDSGLRRNEVLQLRWQDLDLDNGRVKVIATHTKTLKEREAPLTWRTRSELEKLPTLGAAGQVFPVKDFKRSWQTALRVAGIKGLTFHDLRRSAITRWQRAGIALGIAAELAGHANIATTSKHYTSADDSSVVRDAATMLDAFINGRPAEADTEFLN